MIKTAVGLAWKVLSLATDILEQVPLKITTPDDEPVLTLSQRIMLSYYEDHLGRMWDIPEINEEIEQLRQEEMELDEQLALEEESEEHDDNDNMDLEGYFESDEEYDYEYPRRFGKLPKDIL